ncbi:MAG: tetratricopeptide repeat protein [Phycisphaerae bacterium]|nr:tetratricopeptide repeat protein [Saprospiraceae bacterium]
MDESLYLRIKQYKNGLLPQAERIAFEQQMQTDPVFAGEVATWAAIYQGIQEKGDAELNVELMGLGKQLLQTQTATPEMSAKVNPEMVARRFSMPRWVYAAAAMLLLLLLAWPIYQRYIGPENTYASAEVLFTEHFSAPAAPTVRDAGRIPWKEAYDQKRYPEAIAALEQLLADTSYLRRSEAQLYLGIAHLSAAQPQQAINDFQQISPNNGEWEDAQWFMALAYLKLNDTVKAKGLLKDIADEASHPWRSKAEEILKKLK